MDDSEDDYSADMEILEKFKALSDSAKFEALYTYIKTKVHNFESFENNEYAQLKEDVDSVNEQLPGLEEEIQNLKGQIKNLKKKLNKNLTKRSIERGKKSTRKLTSSPSMP